MYRRNWTIDESYRFRTRRLPLWFFSSVRRSLIHAARESVFGNGRWSSVDVWTAGGMQGGGEMRTRACADVLFSINGKKSPPGADEWNLDNEWGRDIAKKSTHRLIHTTLLCIDIQRPHRRLHKSRVRVLAYPQHLSRAGASLRTVEAEMFQ